MRGIAAPVEQRFWARVIKTEGCWLWPGESNHYGKIGYGRHALSVHRLSWELHYGPVPAGLLVLHHCDTKRCVHPDHLFLGTHKDNSQDMVRKGRHGQGYNRGEASHWARLTAAQVAEIRQRYPAETQLQLAQAFGVGRSTIGGVVRRKTWANA